MRLITETMLSVKSNYEAGSGSHRRAVLFNVYQVAYSPDGKSILTGSDDWTALLWDITDVSLPVAKKKAAHTTATVSLLLPTRSQIVLSGLGATVKGMVVELYHPSGRLIARSTLPHGVSGTTVIDLGRSITAGLYLYRITATGKRRFVHSGSVMAR